MKKLFFAAAFAVVAVAGAFATNSKSAVQTGNFYSQNSNEQDVICDAGPRLCSAFYDEGWDKPASDLSRIEVDLTQYEHSN